MRNIFFCWMEALSARSDHCRAAGHRMRGTMVLGEMDVARAKPKPRPRGTHPSSRRRPPTVRRAARGHLCPGGRRPPGPELVGHWRMGDDVRKEQTDGSVVMRNRNERRWKHWSVWTIVSPCHPSYPIQCLIQ